MLSTVVGSTHWVPVGLGFDVTPLNSMYMYC